MSRLTVAVLRGGPSSEYDVSLCTGAQVLSHLREMEDKYEPADIFISKEGDWHVNGIVMEPHKALRHADVVWNALHGAYGEDGRVQRLLEHMYVPFTGSGTAAAALSMDKHASKEAYAVHGLLCPNHKLIESADDEEGLVYIHRNYLMPVVVKPVRGGSSIGIRLAHTLVELKDAVVEALRHSGKAIVEELVRGREVTCGVVEHARGEQLYAIMPVEIKKPSGRVFDYELKYSEAVEKECPGSLSQVERKAVEEMAKAAHLALGLRHYSRSDFIITRSGKVYILETNSLPGLTEHCTFPHSLHAVGWHPRDFVDHCVELALRR